MTDRAPPAPSDLDAAIAHYQAGRLAEAEAIYRRILVAAPRDVDALHLLGLVALGKGEAANAATFIEKAIALNPGVAPFHNSLGNALKAKGNLEPACDSFRKALDLDPTLTGVHVNLGDALWAQGNLEAAEQEYRAVAARSPQHFEALKKLGALLKAQDKPNDAVTAFRKALEINGDDAEIHNSLGATLLGLDHIQDAIIHFQQAIDIDRHFPQAHNNLGSAWQKQGDSDKAIDCFQTSISLDSEFAPAHDNLGVVYSALGKYEKAIACHDHALSIEPDLEGAEFRKATLLLRLGRFDEAWKSYLNRPSVSYEAPELHRNPLPADLSGSEFFLRKNQGLGDEIFFLRFAPELFRRGAKITYKAGSKIASILKRLPFLDEIVDENAAPSPGQLNVSLGDLPYMLGFTSTKDIPPPYPLPIEPRHRSAIEEKLNKAGPAPYVGMTWRAGTPNETWSLYKETSCEQMGRALSNVNGTFLALQRKPEAGEIDRLAEYIGRPVHDFTALNDDLEAMLALLSLIDEYICVSNTNVHLRAGAGRTSRVLVPTPPEWRWMAEGDESPWFPGTGVYRQGHDQSWDAAFSRLAQDLLKAHGPA